MTDWRALKPHPFSLLLEKLSDDEFEVLVASMRMSGFLKGHPIYLFEGAILAGRHRHRAAIEADLDKIVTVEWTGTKEDAAAFVWQEQLGRRSLNKNQRAAVMAKFREMMGLDIEAAAKKAGVSISYMQKASSIHARSPDATEKAIAGELSISKAAKRIERAIPRRDKNDEPEWRETAKEIAVARKELREWVETRIDPLLARPGAEHLIASIQRKKTDKATGKQSYGFALIDMIDNTLRANAPQKECPDCGGLPQGCGACGGFGYITAAQAAGRK